MKVQELAHSPHDFSQTKQLKGVDALRLRVGDWRVIYTVDHDVLKVCVIKIASRGEVYQNI